MKRLLLSIFLLGTIAQAQHVMSDRLQSALNNANHIDQTFSIRIEMIDKIDAFEMHKSFIASQTPIHDRAVQIVSSHKENAVESQRNLLEYIEKNIPQAFFSQERIAREFAAFEIESIVQSASISLVGRSLIGSDKHYSRDDRYYVLARKK